MVMVDSGADYSIISERSLSEAARKEVTEWRGLEVGTIHLPFGIRGEWQTMMGLGETEVGARFCVVDADMETPILGLDWEKHHRINRDWTLNRMAGTDPTSGAEFTAPIETPGETVLRLKEVEKLKKGRFTRVVAEAPGAKCGMEWLVEDTFTTAGILKVPEQQTICEKDGELRVWMVNLHS